MRKKAEPRQVVALPATLYDRLVKEQERVLKTSGLHVSLAALVRKAIENTFKG
jgi:hypothetical protein